MVRIRSEFSSTEDEAETSKEEPPHLDPYRTPPNRITNLPIKVSPEGEERKSGIRFKPYGSPESPYEIAISGLKPKMWGRSPYQLKHLKPEHDSPKIKTPVKCLTYDSPIRVPPEEITVARCNTIAFMASKLLKEKEEALKMRETSPFEERTNFPVQEVVKYKAKRRSSCLALEREYDILVDETKKLKISTDIIDDEENLLTNGVRRRIIPGLAVPDFSFIEDEECDELNKSDELHTRSDKIDFYHFPVMRNYKTEMVTIRPSVLADAIFNYNSPKHTGFRIIVIDCRFPYEYDGGHIIGAHNFYTEEAVENFFFDGSRELLFDEQERISLFIFHCEFSSKRGPKLANFIRDMDRELHCDCYPKLFFPEMYVLYGGYREFYTAFPELCEPSGYIEMLDKRFNEERLAYTKLTNKSKVNRDKKGVCTVKTVRRRIF